MTFTQFRKIAEKYRKGRNLQPYSKSELDWLKWRFKRWPESERLLRAKEIGYATQKD